jgi:hypothetical protein
MEKTAIQQLGQITGSMEKEALGTKLIAAVMSRANKAGKFAGKPGIARRDKFVKSLQNWLWGHNKRVKSELATVSKASPKLPYSQMSRTSWKPLYEAGTKLDELPSSPLYQPHKKVFDKLHEAFTSGPGIPKFMFREGYFKPPKVNLQAAKPVAESWVGPAFSPYKEGPKWSGWVYGGRQIPTLLHEMGHAYTMGPKASLMPKIKARFEHGPAGAGLVDLFPEVQANRAAANALRRLRGQSTIKNLPTTKQYYDYARPQYDAYRTGALQDFLKGSIVGSDVPAWIKRMGLPVRRRSSPSARGYKRYLAGRDWDDLP